MLNTIPCLAVLLAWLAGPGLADTNFLTGSNDIIAVREETGQLAASPFSVQFGKKDIWLPRSGHRVTMKVNSLDVPVEMILDSEGRAYFSTNNTGRRTRATAGQLAELGLRPGVNTITFSVETVSGSEVTTASNIHLLHNNARIVVSDIDGTVTKSNIKGFLLPALGLSDWKHEGVVELFSEIAGRGYSLLYLTNRPIGESDRTRQYISSLSENQARMPGGPIFLQVDSLLGVTTTELFSTDPGANKAALLSEIKGLFHTNPFVAGFGNKEWDSRAYLAVDIPAERIYDVDESGRVEVSGRQTTYRQISNNINLSFPAIN